MAFSHKIDKNTKFVSRGGGDEMGEGDRVRMGDRHRDGERERGQLLGELDREREKVGQEEKERKGESE